VKIAILGAGISGISLFDILQSKYGITADIYESENTIGGLCRTAIIDDYVYDLSGGHIFNTKFDDVREYVFTKLRKDAWTFSNRKSNIAFDDITIDYPFEFSLSKLSTEVAVECIEGLYNRKDNNKINNFEDFLLHSFGEGIMKYYLRPYNEKIWKKKLSDLDYNWVQGKMPYPKAKEILMKTLSNDTSEKNMVHSTYYYPNNGGIQTLINEMGKNIPHTHIGEKIISIKFDNGKIAVNGIKYDLVVNTIPLPELNVIIQNIDKKLKENIEGLSFNSILSLLYPIDKENDWSWTYLPEDKLIPHRIVYQGNLAIGNAPVGRSSITVEISNPDLTKMDEILLNIKQYLGLKNPISEYVTKYAYVVFDLSRQSRMNFIKEYFKDKNFILHGRFAEWEYPNMDVCIKKSFDLAERIGKLI
jgi:protoporphyrinogen oxidase